MKSDIETKDILYSIIQGSVLHNRVTGELYKDARPTNSDKEDIVISVLDGLNGLYQEMVVNVNIYTQDLQRDNDNIENASKIRDLSRLAIDLLHGKTCNDYIIKVKSQRILKVKDHAEHVINTQLLLTHINF